VAGPATAVGDAPIVLAQAPGINIDVGVGDRGRGGVVVQERDRDRRGVVVRERDRFDRGRVEVRPRVVVRRAPACRMITERTRTPSGRIIIRTIRRCF
jgi:hypothetical protein